ncbi:MAG TPA: hypothetical protein VF746_32425 [Longimicrobium sp.]|jgi:hypothetical protein
MSEAETAPQREAAGGVNAFVGTWRLRPEASRYEHGQPPREAVYRIEREGEWLLFAARWTGADGRRLEMSFAGVADGEPHPYDDPEVADTLTVRLADARTLDTIAAKDGREVAFGRRVLSEDGRVLTVTQSGTRPDGSPFVNVSVYDRA